jgi:hypothetical protein
MQLELGNAVYTLAPEQEAWALAYLAQQMLSQMAEFRRGHPAVSLALKAMAREMLAAFEKEARKAGQPEDVCRSFRPPKKVDAVAHLQVCCMKIIQERLSHVSLIIDTDDDRITRCHLVTNQSQGGGSLDPHGDVGEREDDGIEVSGRSLLTPVSDGAALRP